jgi:hypothetical protein
MASGLHEAPTKVAMRGNGSEAMRTLGVGGPQGGRAYEGQLIESGLQSSFNSHVRSNCEKGLVRLKSVPSADPSRQRSGVGQAAVAIPQQRVVGRKRTARW